MKWTLIASPIMTGFVENSRRVVIDFKYRLGFSSEHIHIINYIDNGTNDHSRLELGVHFSSSIWHLKAFDCLGLIGLLLKTLTVFENRTDG